MTKMLSASGGLSPPDPLTRGSAPGPRWGLCPQTPVMFVLCTCHGAPQLLLLPMILVPRAPHLFWQVYAYERTRSSMYPIRRVLSNKLTGRRCCCRWDSHTAICRRSDEQMDARPFSFIHFIHFLLQQSAVTSSSNSQWAGQKGYKALTLTAHRYIYPAPHTLRAASIISFGAYILSVKKIPVARFPKFGNISNRLGL